MRHLLSSALLCCTLAGGALAADPATLTVDATGTASGTPDQAHFDFGVHTTDEEASDAMEAANTAMAQAFQALTGAGVAEEDIQTAGISLAPRFEHYQRKDGNSPPRILGYEASNTVSVTVDDPDALGAVLDALVESGVNAINAVSFSVADPSELENAARAMAARKAREKAETYATAIGTEVTGILSMTEEMTRHPQPHMMEMARGPSMAKVPTAKGTEEIRAQLRVVFSLSGTLE